MQPSQEMFMLFFSILYGIMLNSLFNLGAFPITHALAHEDVIKRVNDKPLFEKGKKSRNRLILSVMLLNIAPFTYFAIAFHFIGVIGNIPSINPYYTILQILFIGFFSLGVFAFPQFFFGIITSSYGYHFYTHYDLERHMNERAIYPNAWKHFQAGLLYLIPGLVIVLVIYLIVVGLGDN